MTGGRIKRVAEYIGDETFCCTYGDCLGDVDIGELIRFHRDQGVLATLTAIQPPGRFGAVVLATRRRRSPLRGEAARRRRMDQRRLLRGRAGSAGLHPRGLDGWEREPLERLASEGALAAYKHRGYWQSMETLRDKMLLESEWDREAAVGRSGEEAYLARSHAA